MDEFTIKQKILAACSEPRAPEELIRKVVLRTQAVTMGVNAQKELENGTAQNVGELASRALIGQLASVSELPKGAQPEQLARQLEQEPSFQAALRRGNVARMLSSGELMQQLAGRKQPDEPVAAKHSVPPKEGPVRE